MSQAVAITGMSCRYADAATPSELWENVLAQRRAFRRLPEGRLRLADYFGAGIGEPDKTYSTQAALIEGYEFDRVRFRVGGETFRSADMTHWLALDVAAQALDDAGFKDGAGLPRETTGVFLGNTLTGEFSRAGVMRLRWPYVRRVAGAALSEGAWSPEQKRALLARLEELYKTPFPPVGEDTLAGGLSNTIAGRVCNHFDLHGGGYTVDGACASSLLAVTNACAALAVGDLDVALAGGVDLSLDPFELVGFAKAGALAREEMRVYDRRPTGFLPGEGCGWLVLMRYEDAVAARRRIYAVIRGWGISSDGGGGLTRPEVAGQTLALARAYRRAGFGIETVSYFEGHGTGTAVGDEVELTALDQSRRAACGEGSRRAAVGSVKANIGHTKAAAGVAGLIKAALALHTRVVPPNTGCQEPHRIFADAASTLRTLKEGEAWPAREPLRAGVSAMGFGGINTHLALEGVDGVRRPRTGLRERKLSSTPQDAELFLLDAESCTDLLEKTDHLLGFASQLSRAEMTDLAARLARDVDDGSLRAAVVASTPAELFERLGELRSRIVEHTEGASEPQADAARGVFLGRTSSERPPSIVFLFPGQGSPTRLDGGAWQRRFECVREVYEHLELPAADDLSATLLAQPAIVASSLAALGVLGRLGVEACAAVGHSLGEMTALRWAGVMGDDATLRIARARGRAMMELREEMGAMVSVAAGGEEVAALLNGDRVVIAGFNSPAQTVVSGESGAVGKFTARAEVAGLRVTRLPVSHAFHSPLVAPAVPALAQQLSSEKFSTPRRRVVSTVTGKELRADTDVVELICRQVTSPVRFVEAARAACEGADLAIEVGPGQILCGLLRDFSACPAVALDACGPSLKGLLLAVGAAFVLGSAIDREFLFAGRLARPFDLDWRPEFFVNPCELAPLSESDDASDIGTSAAATARVFPSAPEEAGTHAVSAPDIDHTLDADHVPDANADARQTPLTVVRQLVARRTELPVEAVRDESRLLHDLHLNSITVGQLVAEAARRLSLTPPHALTDFADVTVAQLADVLDELKRTGGASSQTEGLPEGARQWVRAFTFAYVERPLPVRQPPSQHSAWRVFAPDGYALADSYRRAFARAHGGGVLVCLPTELEEEHAALLLDAAREVFREKSATRFVLAQHGESAASFARTLHLEAPWVHTSVVTVPEEEGSARRVLDEAQAVEGFSEALYDESGRRFEPRLRVLQPDGEEDASSLPLTASDVLLVTGGGKGIAAECALSLARETGVRLALLGRARPDADAELAANLKRLTDCGITFRYFSADVTDAESVRAAVGAAQSTLGPLTAFLHGAGTNTPRTLPGLAAEDFARTLAPKVRGARNVLAALDPARLRLFISFGSIIGRMGMAAEADYAVANEWLTNLTMRWQAEHPHCRCLALEWSVWSGVGMGERLGSVERLARAGVTHISVDEGLRVLRQLLRRPAHSGPLVVTGRLGHQPTLKVEEAELPFLRFLEKPRVYLPGVELIADAELTLDNDPYLDEHALQGHRLFPAVLGLEAMAQAAMALAATTEVPTFENVSFESPVVVGDEGRLTLRVAALAVSPGEIEVVLRSEGTSFKVDHFKATCRFGAQGTVSVSRQEQTAVEQINDPQIAAAPSRIDGRRLGLDASADLYETILFHRGRFRRIEDYRRLCARECVAELAPPRAEGWFGRYLPSRLVLGDPAARDAAVHAIQACIPQAALLPTGVARVTSGPKRDSAPHRVSARERMRRGDEFIYDVEITDESGAVCERWEGLSLKLVGREIFRGPWAAPLLGPLVERRVEEALAVSGVRVAVENGDGAARGERAERALQRALGFATTVGRRPDGKPEVLDSPGWHVSVAHAHEMTVAVAARRTVACDVERVVVRETSVWLDLLGREKSALAEVISEHACEDAQTSRARAWAAVECLRKSGAASDSPLVLVPASSSDGWVRLSSGTLNILTYAFELRGTLARFVLAVLADAGQGTDAVAAPPRTVWSSSHVLHRLDTHPAPHRSAEQETAP